MVRKFVVLEIPIKGLQILVKLELLQLKLDVTNKQGGKEKEEKEFYINRSLDTPKGYTCTLFPMSALNLLDSLAYSTN